MGTKLRGGGNDGYLLQLGEIEAYGKPVCDKTVLEEAIATFKAEGGDESAREYKEATAALENPLLTQTQARDYAKKLLALVGKELETDPPETDPVEPETNEPASDDPTETTAEPSDDPTAAPTDPAEDPTNEPEAPAETDAPAKGGCKASVSLSALLALCGAASVIRKKRED